MVVLFNLGEYLLKPIALNVYVSNERHVSKALSIVTRRRKANKIIFNSNIHI